MSTPPDTTALRRAYARAVMAAAGIADARVERAFAEVPREAHLGPPPWRLHEGGSPWPTETDDPALLYQDALVALAPERHINNGQPSLHAHCLATLAPAPGDHALHVGAGTGYYTALLHELVAPGGRVTAYEIEADLAAQAAQALVGRAGVQVLADSGADRPLPAADVIYVSAGAARPPAAWLDALRPGGRLLFPLTGPDGLGAMLLVARAPPDGGVDDADFSARFLMRVAFVGCRGTHDDETAGRALADTLRQRALEPVRSLRRGDEADGSAWYQGRGWWLSTAPPRWAGRAERAAAGHFPGSHAPGDPFL